MRFIRTALATTVALTLSTACDDEDGGSGGMNSDASAAAASTDAGSTEGGTSNQNSTGGTTSDAAIDAASNGAGSDAATETDAASVNADIPDGLSDDCAAVYKAACIDGCIDNPGVDTSNQCNWATENQCGLCTSSLNTFRDALLDTCGWPDLPASTGACND